MGPDEDAGVDDSRIAASDEGGDRLLAGGAPRAARGDRSADRRAALGAAREAFASARRSRGASTSFSRGTGSNTQLEFASSELPVELDAIRTALSRKKRWVALSDGTLSRISSSIEALAEEAVERDGRRAKARLPAHQLGRLDRWVEENDGRIDAAVRCPAKPPPRARRRRRARHAGRASKATLRPYQRLGLAWLQFLQALGAGGILADDMGLGKTITTLAFLLRRKEVEGPAPSLVVCPTSVATNWVREAARFTPGLRVLLYHGPKRERARRRRSPTPTSSSPRTRSSAATSTRSRRFRFRCAVLDEAQNIKNSDSATTRAAGRLDASMRLALSGTPIENRLRELWSLASFANPGILGTARAFETRFERPISTDRGSPLAAELRAVVRPFLLRRTKDDVLRELPPKTEIDRDGHAEERRQADVRRARARAARQRGARTSRSAAASARSACSRRSRACGRWRATLASSTRGSSTKGPRARSGRRSSSWCASSWPRGGARSCSRSSCSSSRCGGGTSTQEKIAYEYLDGRTTKRDEVVARFQEGTAPLFLISLKAGGAGLNLTGADTVIHCDPWWNPAVEDQATDRAYRIGQGKPVTVVRLIARGTIEEKMLSLKAKKRELTQVVIGDDARALEGLTEEDVRALLGSAEADREVDDEDDENDGAPKRSPTDVLATATRVNDPDFDALVVEVQWWLASTGSFADELASIADIPLPIREVAGERRAVPCSRAAAEKIRARLRAW